MWRICLACLLTSWMAGAAWARMYQWTDPRSGRTHMSGTPPAWYRSDEAGPRVFVFENGQIIDDTRIAVSAETRQALREQAFKNAPPSVLAPAETAGAAATSAAPTADDMGAASSGVTAEPAADTPAPQNVSPEVMAKLKQALERWDQTHSSKLSLPAPAPPSP